MAATKRRGRGEGSIEELPSGKYRAVLSAGEVLVEDAKGGRQRKRRKMTFTADTKREAQAWLRERQAGKDKGTLADCGKMTVGEWLDRRLAAHMGKVAGKTYDHDECRARLHLRPLLGHVPLARLTALHVEEMLAKWRPRAAGTGAGTAARSGIRPAACCGRPWTKQIGSGWCPPTWPRT